MEVPINVRRFMGAFYSFWRRRKQGMQKKKKGGPTCAGPPSRG
jgi:hypothetical protein